MFFWDKLLKRALFKLNYSNLRQQGSPNSAFRGGDNVETVTATWCRSDRNCWSREPGLLLVENEPWCPWGVARRSRRRSWSGKKSEDRKLFCFLFYPFSSSPEERKRKNKKMTNDNEHFLLHSVERASFCRLKTWEWKYCTVHGWNAAACAPIMCPGRDGLINCSAGSR